jgi:diguanylate cyclase (GGDEF)-like protein
VNAASQPEPTAASGAANDFDALSRLAGQVCDTPLASVSLLRGERVWFLATHGQALGSVDASIAFEPHAFGTPNATLMVPNTVSDSRFSGHPFVAQQPRIRFYAGATIFDAEGEPLGCLSVMDYVPRSISAEQATALRVLARQVSTQLTLRRLQTDLAQESEARRELQERLASYQSRLDDALVRLNTESTIDALTNLPNRRAFDARLDEETDRARRYDLPISLLLIEIDRFAQQQAIRGHDGGNELLKRLAQHLRRGLRQSDMLSRFSPHGFAVILPNTGFDGCCALAERMARSVAAADWAAKDVTISSGMSSQASADAHSQALITEASKALAMAKQGSGDRRLHYTNIV